MIAEVGGPIMEKEYAKEIRHEGTKTGWSIIGYVLLMNVVVIIGMFVDIIALIIEKSGGDVAMLTVADYEEITMKAMANLTSNGTSSIIAVCIGILLLMLIYKRRVTIKSMWAANKKMSVKNFFMIFCVFMACQPIFTILSKGIEALLNALGYSAQGQLEWAAGAKTGLSMIIYAGFVGPIAEEIVYRGFVMKSLTKYGKHFAIVTSAIMFGVMHANIYQLFFAILVGLVLGYVATEYSLKWAVLIHIINNFVVSQLLGGLLGKLPETTQYIIWYSILGLFFIAALIIMWNHREQIKVFYQENKVMMKQYIKFFVSVGMIVFIVFHVIFMLVGIQPVIQ